MNFVQDVNGGYENGLVEVGYSVKDEGGLVGFEGKLKVSPLALLKLLAQQTKTKLDDEAIGFLEQLLANAKANV